MEPKPFAAIWGKGARDAAGSLGSEGLVGIGTFTSFAALGTIQLADGFGAQFENTLLDTVLLIFSSADRPLHHNMRTTRHRASVLGQLAAEGDDAVPLGSALPLAIAVLPGFLRCH